MKHLTLSSNASIRLFAVFMKMLAFRIKLLLLALLNRTALSKDESKLLWKLLALFRDNLLNDDPIPEYERFTFNIEPDAPVINNFDELNEDECFDPGGGEIDVSQNIEDDDSFAFVIRTFLPYRTYPVDSPLLLSTGSEDTIFDPGIST
ncbi:hypothetical protein Tco_1487626 [Tanacetum coccineum]